MSDQYPAQPGASFIPPADQRGQHAGPPVVTPPSLDKAEQAASEPRLSLRDRILLVDDLGSESVYVEEWHETVLVRGITVGERNDAISESRNDETGKVNLALMYALMVVSCALDPQTRRNLFSTADVTAILSKSPGAIDKVALTAMRLSGMTPPEDVPEGSSSDELSVEAAGKASSSIPGGEPSYT